jgi:hypothetical protein
MLSLALNAVLSFRQRRIWQPPWRASSSWTAAAGAAHGCSAAALHLPPLLRHLPPALLALLALQRHLPSLLVLPLLCLLTAPLAMWLSWWLATPPTRALPSARAKAWTPRRQHKTLTAPLRCRYSALFLVFLWASCGTALAGRKRCSSNGPHRRPRLPDGGEVPSFTSNRNAAATDLPVTAVAAAVAAAAAALAGIRVRPSSVGGAPATATSASSASASALPDSVPAPPAAGLGVLGSSTRSAHPPSLRATAETRHHQAAAAAASSATSSTPVSSPASTAAAVSVQAPILPASPAAASAPPPCNPQTHRRGRGDNYWWAMPMPRREPPTRGLLWMNPWGTGMQRNPHRVELYFTGSGEQAWTLNCGQYICEVCYPYIFVGNHDSINTATGHVYYPIYVNGAWLNAKTLKPLPVHMIGNDAEMEHFVLPPRDVYAQWDERIRLQGMAATLPPVPTPETTTRTFVDPLLVTLQENYEKASSTDSDAGTGESYGEATFTDGDDDDDLSSQLHLFVAR